MAIFCSEEPPRFGPFTFLFQRHCKKLNPSDVFLQRVPTKLWGPLWGKSFQVDAFKKALLLLQFKLINGYKYPTFKILDGGFSCFCPGLLTGGESVKARAFITEALPRPAALAWAVCSVFFSFGIPKAALGRAIEVMSFVGLPLPCPSAGISSVSSGFFEEWTSIKKSWSHVRHLEAILSVYNSLVPGLPQVAFTRLLVLRDTSTDSQTVPSRYREQETNCRGNRRTVCERCNAAWEWNSGELTTHRFKREMVRISSQDPAFFWSVNTKNAKLLNAGDLNLTAHWN